METRSMPPANPGFRRSVVLVADDSEAFRTRLALLVGHVPGVSEVVQASNGAEALEAIRSLHPRVALLDVQLDGGAGALLTRIKEEFPATVLVALTRYAGPMMAATYRNSGADHCFDKTTELDAMIQTVGQWMKQDPREEPS